MGQALCPLFKNAEVKVLFIGLDAAGKTTLLYKLKLGEVVTTIPTIGFNVETVDYNGVSMTTWDVGSRDKMRPLWRHYFDLMDALVFLMDSSDRERLDEAVEELMRVVPDVEDRQVPILILANKQDIDGVMSHEEIREAITKHKTRIHTPFEVFPISAVDGDGVAAALDWLTSLMTSKIAEKSVLFPVKNALYNAAQYPTSAVKSSWRAVAGLFSHSSKSDSVVNTGQTDQTESLPVK